MLHTPVKLPTLSMIIREEPTQIGITNARNNQSATGNLLHIQLDIASTAVVRTFLQSAQIRFHIGLLRVVTTETLDSTLQCRVRSIYNPERSKNHENKANFMDKR